MRPAARLAVAAGATLGAADRGATVLRGRRLDMRDIWAEVTDDPTGPHQPKLVKLSGPHCGNASS